MKTPFKLLASAGAAALLLTSPGLQAESTYGYQSTGTGAVSATARVNVNVTVPKLILLRVGTNGGTGDTVTVAVAPISIPGGAATPSTGNSQASDWNETEPTMAITATASAITARTLTATAWTNATGAGLTGAVTSDFDAASGLTAADVVVTSSGDLAHPGANTGAFGTVASPTTTAIPRNTVRTATWIYSLSTAGLEAAAAGTHSQTVTYTASAL